MTVNNPRFFSTPDGSAVLHLRFDGRSRDISLDILDVGVASSDESIRSAVSAYLDMSAKSLSGYVVERHENGNMTLRPEAVFG